MDPTFLIFMAIAIGGLLFLSNRTRRQQAKQAEFRDSLEPGQDVMTLSGFLGTIVEVEGDTITLVSVDGARTRWVRAAIGKVVEPTVEDVETEAAAEVEAEASEPDQDSGPEIFDPYRDRP